MAAGQAQRNDNSAYETAEEKAVGNVETQRKAEKGLSFTDRVGTAGRIVVHPQQLDPNVPCA